MVDQSVQHSFCAGIFWGNQQVAFGRTITDYSTYGYLADVFVDPQHRGKELGKVLVEMLIHDPALAQVPKFSLRTLDAQGLYAQFGFHLPEFPDRVMDYKRPDSH
jgi:GNAT superfamily N-acetyltransferase